MPIPEFGQDGWLPEGDWQASWDEIAALFSGVHGGRRAEIHARLVAWHDALRELGVHGRLILDGSFASEKRNPGDCDCLFVYDDSLGRLDEREETRALTDYATLKAEGLGDIFVFPLSLTQNLPHLFQEDVFDYDKNTRMPKGVIEVEI